jgi:hypothetical protein
VYRIGGRGRGEEEEECTGVQNGGGGGGAHTPIRVVSFVTERVHLPTRRKALSGKKGGGGGDMYI